MQSAEFDVKYSKLKIDQQTLADNLKALEAEVECKKELAKRLRQEVNAILDSLRDQDNNYNQDSDSYE